MSNTSNEAANWYTSAFKGWQVKTLGDKPTAEQLDTIHKLSARPGKQALACAMALRDSGVTAGQIIIACGAPQLNKMRGFITDGLLKREAVAPDAKGHSVYKLTLTKKGEARIAKTAALIAADTAKGEAEPAVKKPVKAKGKAKAKKAAKAKPAIDATSEAASVTVNVPAEAGNVQQVETSLT